MPPANPDVLAQTADELLSCVCSALVAAGVLAEDCCDPDGDGFRAFVANGEVAFDSCCIPCGQLSVKLARIYETDAPPAQLVGPAPCGDRQLVADWEVTWLRCVSVTDDTNDSLPPSAAQISAEAVVLYRALWVVWAGLGCCFAAWAAAYDPRQGWVANASLIGPEGECGGIGVTAQTVIGPSCDCSGTPIPPPV